MKTCYVVFRMERFYAHGDSDTVPVNCDVLVKAFMDKKKAKQFIKKEERAKLPDNFVKHSIEETELVLKKAEKK